MNGHVSRRRQHPRPHTARAGGGGNYVYIYSHSSVHAEYRCRGCVSNNDTNDNDYYNNNKQRIYSNNIISRYVGMWAAARDSVCMIIILYIHVNGKREPMTTTRRQNDEREREREQRPVFKNSLFPSLCAVCHLEFPIHTHTHTLARTL